MLIETWLAALLFLLIGGIAFTALIGWILEGMRLDECRKENDFLKKEVRDRNELIKQLKGKMLVKDATDFYNEGKKK
jgi:hypothetical protein